jgi:hypothetical protein
LDYRVWLRGDLTQVRLSGLTSLCWPGVFLAQIRLSSLTSLCLAGVSRASGHGANDQEGQCGEFDFIHRHGSQHLLVLRRHGWGSVLSGGEVDRGRIL